MSESDNQGQSTPQILVVLEDAMVELGKAKTSFTESHVTLAYPIVFKSTKRDLARFTVTQVLNEPNTAPTYALDECDDLLVLGEPEEWLCASRRHAWALIPINNQNGMQMAEIYTQRLSTADDRKRLTSPIPTGLVSLLEVIDAVGGNLIIFY